MFKLFIVGNGIKKILGEHKSKAEALYLKYLLERGLTDGFSILVEEVEQNENY